VPRGAHIVPRDPYRDGVRYTVRDQDIVNGFIAVNAKTRRQLGTSFNHTNSTDSVGGTPRPAADPGDQLSGGEQRLRAGGLRPRYLCLLRSPRYLPGRNTGAAGGLRPDATLPGCFDRHDTCKVATPAGAGGCDPTLAFPGCSTGLPPATTSGPVRTRRNPSRVH